MNRKKVLKILGIIAFIIIVSIFLYNFISGIAMGNTRVEVILNNKYYSGNDLDAVVKVYSKDYNSTQTLKSKVKVQLCDSNGKKVKGTKEKKYACDNSEEIKIDYKLPEDLEVGNYILKFKVSSKKGFEKFEKNIIVQNSKSHNLVISLAFHCLQLQFYCF